MEPRQRVAHYEILGTAGNEFPLVLSVEAGLMLEQGRFAAWYAFMTGIPENDSPCWDRYRAFVLTSGVVPPDPERMEAVEPQTGLGSARAVALYGLEAEIAECDGDNAAALEYYGWPLELWADCDPSLQPERDRVRAAMAALES